jgi:hypothetical protein
VLNESGKGDSCHAERSEASDVVDLMWVSMSGNNKEGTQAQTKQF